jgi:UPF0271 protein
MIRKEKYEPEKYQKAVPFGIGLQWFVDLNCDMGEGMGNDADIMPYISSANIACGYHAGDEETMKRTVELCIKHNVAIGAHPSFEDKKNFGRMEMHLPASEIYDIITKQIHLLEKIAKQYGASLHHIKPHGALYNMSAKSNELATTIAQAVKDVNEKFILYGLSGSYSITKAKEIGLKPANEVFADRTYQDDGSLTPRSQPNALIEDANKSLQQVLKMIKQKMVTSVSGKIIPIVADTICVHGDGKHAIEFAKQIHVTLEKEQIKIQSSNW